MTYAIQARLAVELKALARTPAPGGCGMLEFTLFGPVSARAGDEDVDLGPFRQRCVLVVLLLEANRRVTLDQLAERVWGPDAPLQAHGTLRSYLSRLRSVLALDDVMLDRRSGGYVLVLARDAVRLKGPILPCPSTLPY